MKKIKFKKLWGASALILTGLAISTPVILSTSCAEKKNYTFNNYSEVSDYLQKHKQNVSNDYVFNNNAESDYEFVKKNINFQFLLNGLLYMSFAGFGLKVIPTYSAKLNVESETTAKVDASVTAEDDSFSLKGTIAYVNSRVNIEAIMNDETKILEIDFDFNETYSADSHYVQASEYNKIGARQIIFDNSSGGTAYLFISPFDWQNKLIIGWENSK